MAIQLKIRLINIVYSIVTIAAGMFSWVIIVKGLVLSGISPTAAEIFSFVGIEVNEITTAVILGSLIQIVITGFYFSWRFSSWRKAHKISLATCIAVVMICFGSYLSLYSVAFDSISENQLSTLESQIKQELLVTQDLESLFAIPYQTYISTSLKALKHESATGCKCLCESKQKKFSLVVNAFENSLGGIQNQEAISASPSLVTKASFFIPKNESTDIGLLFAELERRRQKLFRASSDYVVFLASQKQGKLDVENLSISSEVSDLPGYNKRTLRCVAFTNSISIDTAAPNADELDRIREEILSSRYLFIKNKIETMQNRGFIPINKVNYTKFWIEENLSTDFYKNPSLLLNIVVSFAADMAAWSMLLFASITSGGKDSKIEILNLEASQYESLAKAEHRHNEEKKRWRQEYLKRIGADRAYKRIRQIFKS